MASQSSPDSLPAGADTSPVDSPSADDLLALVPDMELLETSAIDARTAHTAVASALGSGRKPGVAPKLTDQKTATTIRAAVPKTTVSDDPYADLMPELEIAETPAPATQTVPVLQRSTRPSPPHPPPTPKPQRAAPRPAPPPVRPIAAATPTVAAKPATAPRVATAPNAKTPSVETVAVPPVMDREFIARNQIVELYLSGKLHVRGAAVFEKFCRENPQILDEIGLPERVHTGLRLLEASGKPEPWQEKPKKIWERAYVPAALAGLVVVLAVALLVLNGRLSDQTRKTAALGQLVADQPLDAATGTSNVDLRTTHGGPGAAFAATLGGSSAQMVNIKIDMTHSDYRAFRINIDRANQGRVAVLNNLIKDSNGELGFSLNTSALGPGTYQLAIEGLDWRGDPHSDSWAAFNIKH